MSELKKGIDEMSPEEKANLLIAVIEVMDKNKNSLGGYYEIKDQAFRVVIALLKSIK